MSEQDGNVENGERRAESLLVEFADKDLNQTILGGRIALIRAVNLVREMGYMFEKGAGLDERDLETLRVLGGIVGALSSVSIAASLVEMNCYGLHTKTSLDLHALPIAGGGGGIEIAPSPELASQMRSRVSSENKKGWQ